MLQRILDIRQGVELQELRSPGKVLPPRVKVVLEIVQLTSKVSLLLNGWVATHKSREDGEVDLEPEFKFLANQILLSKHDWHMSVPEGKKGLSVASIEGLTHLLDAWLLVLKEGLLDVRVAYLTHLILQHLGSLWIAVLVQVLKDGGIDVSLGGGEVVEVQSLTASCLQAASHVWPIFASTLAYPCSDTLKCIWILSLDTLTILCHSISIISKLSILHETRRLSLISILKAMSLLS